MKHYTIFCMSKKDFKEAIKNKVPLDILTLGEYWHPIGEFVYDWDEDTLDKCFDNWNYRLTPEPEPFELTEGCLSDYPYKRLPEGYLF